MRCRCGRQISLSDIPNEFTYLFISDVEFDNFPSTVETSELYLSMKESVLCPSCQRIWIFKKGCNEPIEYVKVEKE